MFTRRKVTVEEFNTIIKPKLEAYHASIIPMEICDGVLEVEIPTKHIDEIDPFLKGEHTNEK